MSVSALPGAWRRAATACALAAAATAVLAGPASAAEPPDLALAANGGSATASSTLGSYPVSAVNDGRRQTGGGYWNDGTQNLFPDWVQVSWASAQQLSKVVLRLPVAGSLTTPQRTMARMTLQYLDGASWRAIAPINGQPNPAANWVAPAAATGKQTRPFYFAPLRTTAIRVLYDGGNSDGWSFLEELEAYDATQVGDYDRAADWLRGEATRLEQGSVRTGFDGTRLYTPDGVGGYGALWVRDWQYMLEGRPQGVGAADARADFIYLITRQRSADGAIPDRVQTDGNPVYNVFGTVPPTDNPQFLVQAAHEYWRYSGDLTLFTRYAAQLESGMAQVGWDATNDLVYIDPRNQHSPYGFTDTIGKHGDELFSSLLWWEAAGNLAELYAAAGDSRASATWAAKASAVRTGLQTLYDRTSGMFLASSLTTNQIDVWGSAYAVALGVTTGTQADAIANWLKSNYDGVVENGQLRHLPAGEYWNNLLAGYPRGTYQNGAFWATPVGWLIVALDRVDKGLARQTAIDLVTYFRDDGPWEASNAALGYRGIGQYVASATTPLAGIDQVDGPNLARSATASASSTHSAAYPVASVNDGHVQEAQGYWNDGTRSAYPDTVQVTWASARTVDKVVLRMPVVSYLTAAARTQPRLTLQYLDGSTWRDVAPSNGQPNPVTSWVVPATATGEEQRTFRFAPLSTTALRVRFDAGNSDGWTFLEELQAFSTGT